MNLHRKFFKILLVFILVVCFIFAAASVYIGSKLLSETAAVTFDKTKLLEVYAQTEIYDNNDNLLDQQVYSHRATASLASLPEYTKDAFISIEDKKFYKHHGLDYARILKALVHNITDSSSVQGASTISQQLIKNTHLSSEKTITRKLREMVLTKKLESQFSKDDILETYLNVIYFGNNSYGIQSAAQNYFNKSASELNLAESAMLAGMIKSPKLYSPVYNRDNCLNRRNLVLSEMLEDKKITQEEYDTALNRPIEISDNQLKAMEQKNLYASAAVNESAELLNISERELALSGIKVYTYLNKDLTKEVSESVKTSEYYPENYNPDAAVIILDNENGGVSALVGKGTNILNITRQPGSAIKPVLVYAPALEYRLITPVTPILDEPIDINGYSPQNVKNDFSGWVSVREAIEKSMNIPAVKTLNYVGVDRAKNFASKNGIEFSDDDNNLALSLGGFTYGVTPLQMANSYMSFANGGNYLKATYIRKIEDENGKVLYENTHKAVNVMGDDTAYLITDMLKSTAKNGTAKKLCDLDFDVAAKTGTVGTDKGNSDAWNVSYTTKNTMCVWYGAKANTLMPQNCNGGTYPSIMAREIYKKIYRDSAPADFTVPESVVYKNIDIKELTENQKIMLANDYLPERYISSQLFSVHNLPAETSKNYMETEVENFEVTTENTYPTIKFTARDYITYEIVRKIGNTEEILKTIDKTSGSVEYTDSKILSETYTDYFVRAIIKNPKTEQQISGTTQPVKIYLESEKIQENNEKTKDKVQEKKLLEDKLKELETKKDKNEKTKWFF